MCLPFVFVTDGVSSAVVTGLILPAHEKFSLGTRLHCSLVPRLFLCGRGEHVPEHKHGVFVSETSYILT